jgi:aspartate aminotransferase
MPTISQRGLTAYTSPIRKLSPFADQAKKEGKHVFHLNIGQPDIVTPQEAISRLQQTPIDILAYSPSKGNQSYLNKLPQYYNRHGIEVSPEYIVITTGASEAILFALMACLDTTEEIIIPEPFYANYIGYAEMANVNVRAVTSYIENGFALPDAAAFQACITPQTRAILLCNPVNPTGCLYTEAQMRELAELVKKHDLYLIVDEVYREFCYDEHPFFSVLNIEDMQDNIIVIDSISKRYSACGARIGAIITRNRDILHIVNRYAEIRLSPPTFGQLLGEYLIDIPDTYLDNVKSEYIKRRDLLYHRLSAMEEVVCYRPNGAFYCFAQLPIDDCDRFCQWLLEAFAYHNKTVMLAPGRGFYFTPGLGRQEVRIAYVLKEEDLMEAMDCLEVALLMYPGREKVESVRKEEITVDF